MHKCSRPGLFCLLLSLLVFACPRFSTWSRPLLSGIWQRGSASSSAVSVGQKSPFQAWQWSCRRSPGPRTWRWHPSDLWAAAAVLLLLGSLLSSCAPRVEEAQRLSDWWLCCLALAPLDLWHSEPAKHRVGRPLASCRHQSFGHTSQSVSTYHSCDTPILLCNWRHFGNRKHLYSLGQCSWCWCFWSCHSSALYSSSSWPSCERGYAQLSHLPDGSCLSASAPNWSQSERCWRTTAATSAFESSSVRFAWTARNCKLASSQVASAPPPACSIQFPLGQRRCALLFCLRCFRLGSPVPIWHSVTSRCQTHQLTPSWLNVGCVLLLALLPELLPRFTGLYLGQAMIPPTQQQKP